MLASLRVRGKLLALLTVPLFALLSVVSLNALEKWRTLQDMDELSSLVDIAVDAGEFIHELQKERGYSAGFISSKGKLFQSEVTEQRTVSAKARARLEHTLKQFDVAFPHVRVSEQFTGVLRKTGDLGSFYRRVDAFEEPATGAIALYSGVIASLQQGLNSLLDNGKDASLYGHTVNLIALINGKEYAGQERALLNTALSAGRFPTPEVYRRWTQRVALQEEYLASFLQHVRHPRQKAFADIIEPKKATVQALRQRVLASLDAPRLDGDAPEWFAASTNYINTLHDIEKAASQDLKDCSELLRVEAGQALWLTLGAGAGIVLLTLVVAWLIMRDINVPLRLTVAFARAVADGRLDAHLALARGDEFGQLSVALNAMLASLNTLIAKADEATRQSQSEAVKAREATLLAEEAQRRAEAARFEGMRAAAERLGGVVSVLASASTELSGQVRQAYDNAHVQSDRIAETATAMEEMNATVLEVTKNSAKGAQLADATREQAERGEEMVRGVVTSLGRSMTRAHELKTSMSLLGTRVGEIGKVLGVISDIADQTNLLALNAAIEAARAGEAGKGFAVVADEVRKLAEKTMLATREVGEAITAIQTETGRNISVVEHTVADMDGITISAEASGTALREIVHMVDLTTDQIRSIATASEEQSATSEEINRSVGAVNSLAQTTTQTMADSAQTVDKVTREVHELEGLMLALRAN